MFKKWFCKHEFHSLTTFKRDVDETLSYDLREFHIIYCPKCGKRKTVEKVEYEALMEKQRIDKEYENIRLK